jgi:hypothetical protein
MSMNITQGIDGPVTESAVSAVSWPAIFAGGMIAIAVSLIMLSLGAGLGFATASPWPHGGFDPGAFTIATGVWLIVTQWVSASVGGYLTGRLRTKWTGVHSHEVFFRDTAHGFLAWALGTVIVAALAAMAASASANSAMHAAAAAAYDSGLSQRDAEDTARHGAAAFAIFTALSMLVGAFVGCVAAALGGQQRDEHL